MRLDLRDMRKTYSKQKLGLADCAADPFDQFKKWFEEAAASEALEPSAMNVATVDEAGRPASRMVLLKEVADDGFVFFTNYDSAKGRALAAHPVAALCFFWPELERSVRIRGTAEKLDPKESDEYFASRPRLSRLGAWASKQSRPLDSKAALMARAAAMETRFPLKVPRPEFWGGYKVLPDEFEFWQGRPSRLHDRVFYAKNSNGGWVKTLLNP